MYRRQQRNAGPLEPFSKISIRRYIIWVRPLREDARTVEEWDQKDLAKYLLSKNTITSAWKRAEGETDCFQSQPTQDLNKTKGAECAKTRTPSNLCKQWNRNDFFSDVARSHLRTMSVDGNSTSGKLTPEVWISFKARLPEMITKHILNARWTGEPHSLL